LGKKFSPERRLSLRTVSKRPREKGRGDKTGNLGGNAITAAPGETVLSPASRFQRRGHLLSIESPCRLPILSYSVMLVFRQNSRPLAIEELRSETVSQIRPFDDIQKLVSYGQGGWKAWVANRPEKSKSIRSVRSPRSMFNTLAL
jgi:hypothetical protein